MSQGTVPKLRLEQLWELLVRIRQFVSSCRHDLLLSVVGWCQDLCLQLELMVVLVSLVFPRIRLRDSGSTSVCPSPSGV